ncbi:hypothetical protein H5410_051532 [Solanum commersonii]|uniref:Uncharacterized protein n=1 Tax=Solanum commersonii TaxID=4109 RepID=A0A9J5WYF0_SOLCO|nr:hypothetical protein H5410_051532 [Solanum commersonii]
MVTSHSIAIKQLETEVGQILSHLNPRQKWGLPSDTMVEKWSMFENVWFGEPKSLVSDLTKRSTSSLTWTFILIGGPIKLDGVNAPSRLTWSTNTIRRAAN